MVEHSAFDELIGTLLGNYFLEQLTEQSEASCVLIARNTASGALFRLRILEVPTSLTPENRIVYLGHFQQEANRIASLEHRHILPLVDYATHSAVNDPTGSSWPYLVSAYFPMKSLGKQLAQKGPIDLVLASRYLDQVADFGVIRMLDTGARSATPGTGKGVYGMNESSAPAPEQILGQTIDTYTDVYALGAVLYRMLTGHRVFRGKTREEIVQQHLQAPIPSLATWRNDLPTGLDDVIARAMAKEPAQRYRQPGEFANAYHQVVAPHDMQRTPFFVASVPTISGQPQEVHSGLDIGAKGANVQQGGSVQRGGNAQRGGNERTGGGVQGRSMQDARVQGGGKPRPYISRRRFLIAGGGVAVAVFAVAVFGRNYLVGNTSPASTPVLNKTGTAPNRLVLARSSDIPSNSAKTFPIAGKNNPGLLIHLPNGRFVAFDSTCTHAGCAVDYIPQDKILKCPCHSAEFDPAKNAAVVQGPAQTPLAAIKISVNTDGTITQG